MLNAVERKESFHNQESDTTKHYDLIRVHKSPTRKESSLLLK